jgi:hypothetical protein
MVGAKIVGRSIASDTDKKYKSKDKGKTGHTVLPGRNESSCYSCHSIDLSGIINLNQWDLKVIA